MSLKIVQDTIKSKNKVFPKIKNLQSIEEKMDKIKDNRLKNSLKIFLKAFNERNK